MDVVAVPSSAALSYDAGQPLSCVSFSPSLHTVAIGGKDIRLLTLSAHAISTQLRTSSYTATTSASLVTSLAFHSSSQPALAPSLLASLSTGSIVLYHVLSSSGLRRPVRVWDEHTRTVNRVLWAGGQDDSAFWSCSQDGLVKRFDLRADSNDSVAAFADETAVRDIAVSPTNPAHLAAAYDNGSITILDVRRVSEPVLTITAHQGLIVTLDWHPVLPGVLASGGIDARVHVWSTTTPAAPLHTITTTSGLSRLAWRPGRDHQLASCASVMDCDVHVWNVPTPFIPLATCRHHHSTVTGLLWRDSGDELLTCSKDGTVQQVAVSAGVSPYHHLSTVAVDWNVRDEVASVEDVLPRSHVIPQRNAPAVFPMQFQWEAAAAASGKLDGAPGLIHIHSLQREMHSARTDDDATAWMSDVDVLVYCARHYRLRDGTALERCRHNAQVARQCGRAQLAHVWDMAALLFAAGSTPQQQPPPPPLGSTAADSADSYLSYRLHTAAVPARGAAEVGVPPPPGRVHQPVLQSSAGQSTALLSQLDIVLDSLPVVHLSHCHRVGLLQPGRYRSSLLSSLVRQLVDGGDVQTVCCVLMALSPLTLGGALSVESLRRYYASYIDTLTRLQLFSTAAETMRLCDDVLLMQRTAKTTSLSLMCARCRRGCEFGEKGPYCAHCKRAMTDCALCQLPVNGLYVWCQGCGHGGHAEHMDDWFSRYVLCPTGCLHRCIDDVRHTAPIEAA